MGTKSCSFHSLPVELRLRILNHTHLGPPETGGYDPKLECLHVRDGRIGPRHRTTMSPPPWTVCSSPSTHHTPTPQCQCRILPMQLFLADRQTRRDAIDVFWTGAHLDLHGTDLGAALTFLRDAVPPEGLARLRRLRLTMTTAQCEGWFLAGGGAVACGYPGGTLESQVAVPGWGGGPPPRLDYRGDLRAIVALLRARADLARLRLEVDMCEGTWPFVEDTLVWDEIEDDSEDEEEGGGGEGDGGGKVPGLGMFRFIYDFYVDVATALCALRGLGDVVLELSAFEQLRPWLEREILGYEREPTFETEYAKRRWDDLWQQPRFYQVIPPWHDVNKRLEGSNYKPDQ